MSRLSSLADCELKKTSVCFCYRAVMTSADVHRSFVSTILLSSLEGSSPLRSGPSSSKGKLECNAAKFGARS